MKHKYDDEQINDASRTAANYGSCGELHSNYLRRFLDALPEPGDPHPEIEFDEVRKGDRIDVLTIYGNHEILTVEARTDSHLLAMGTQIPAENYAESIRLIDRPVVHLDPEQHPVILVRESVNTKYDKPIPMIWDGGEFYESPKTSLHISTITEWSPAKVVADNDC